MEKHIDIHIYRLRHCRFIGSDGKPRKTAANARIENLWRCRCGHEIWIKNGINPNIKQAKEKHHDS